MVLVISDIRSGAPLFPHQALALEGPLLLNNVITLLLHLDYLLVPFSSTFACHFVAYSHTAAKGVNA